MIPHSQWQQHRRTRLKAIDDQLASAEKRRCQVLELLDIAVDNYNDSETDALSAELSNLDNEIESLQRSHEGVYNETFEEFMDDARYDAWKAARDDGEV